MIESAPEVRLNLIGILASGVFLRLSTVTKETIMVNTFT